MARNHFAARCIGSGTGWSCLKDRASLSGLALPLLSIVINGQVVLVGAIIHVNLSNAGCFYWEFCLGIVCHGVTVAALLVLPGCTACTACPAGSYDVVLLELGVLHYFIDLAPLAAVIAQLLRPGGRLILREFHPVSTKLISSQGRKHKVTGNYFAQGLVRSSVAYSKYSTAAGGVGGGGSSSSSSGDGVQAGRAGGKRALRAGGGDRSSAFATSSAGVGVDSAGQSVCLRQWGLGEVVTAVAQAGLVVQCLEEEPGVKADDEGIPKLFTLVAVK